MLRDVWVAKVQLILLKATARNVGRSPTVATLSLAGYRMTECGLAAQGRVRSGPLFPRDLWVGGIQFTINEVTARTGAVPW